MNYFLQALRWRWFFFTITFVIVTNVFAQQYNFVNYSIEDGLIQSQVKSMCQDHEGYIWLGTLGGLSRWNGVDFQNFSINEGLLDNGIYSLLTASDGKVFIGTKGGVNVYDEGEIKTYKFNDDLKEQYVRSIVEGKNQELWFGLDNGFVVKYEKDAFTYVDAEKGQIRHLFCDEENKIWISARRGISIVDNQGAVKDYISDLNVSQLMIHHDTIWYSTYRDGVFYECQGKKEQLTTEDGLIQNNIRGFKKTSQNELWFYSKKGMTRYVNGEMKNFTIKEGLSYNNVRCLMEDHEGNLFIGLDGNGLFKFSGDRFIGYTTQDGLDNEGILSIVEDEKNNLWFSSNGGGVALFKNENITNYNVSDGLINNTVWSSLKTKDGNILFGTTDGISLFDGEKFIDLYEDKDDHVDNKVWSLYEDGLGNIWAGTIKGLLYIDFINDTVVNYSDLYGLNKNIKSIVKIDDEKLWFCSDNGIHQYAIKMKQFSWFSMSDGLPDNFIMNATLDKNGIVWIGTTNGLTYFKDNQFVKVNHSNISGANFITFLKVDNNNNLWVGTNKGLFQLLIDAYDQLSPNDFKYYSNLDGLKGLECNQNSVFIDSRKNLWFGTNKGLMKFDLNKQNDSGFKPYMRLKGVRLFFEDIDLAKFSDSINYSTYQAADVTFKYNQDHLTFDYIGINHSNPSVVRYQFKLDGFDEVWSPITNVTSATYSNLSSGQYSFYVKASSDNKNWTEPLQFSFSITPPFYFTWWFYLLSIVFIGGIIWVIIVRRGKILEDKRATQLVIDKSKMLSLEQQALNASMNRHFIFNSLNSIQYYINRQDKFSANKYLTNFAKLVRKNLDNSLENAIYIEEEIERIELYLKLEQMRFQDKFNYQIKIDRKIDPQSLKIPSMLLQPFIENSIWHGILPSNNLGDILVDVRIEQDKLMIDIKDNGIGIDESLALKKDKKQGHISKGMELTKNRIELVGKISSKKCFIDGPKQMNDENNKVLGTSVSIVINI